MTAFAFAMPPLKEKFAQFPGAVPPATCLPPKLPWTRIPGSSATSSIGSRPLSGKSTTWRFSTTALIVLLSELSRTADACTSTISWFPPMVRVKSMRAIWSTSRMIGSRLICLNPGACVVTR